MTTAQRVAGGLLALIFIAGGLGHALAPDATAGLVPSFIPQRVAHLTAAVTELAVGVGVFVPAWRQRALWGIIALLVAFLPLHFVDALREAPVIGPPAVA